jgi:S1-C subfamily serine protease
MFAPVAPDSEGSGWGAPPPAHDLRVPPPPLPGTSGGPGRRTPVLAALALLVAGLIAGTAGSRALGVGGRTSTAELRVSTGSVPGGPTTAESVAQLLGPATGTVVAQLAASQNSLGSGFVIAHDGGSSYVVTNNHVVSGAQHLHVVMPGGRNLAATLVGADALDDVAVISVPDTTLPAATWGPSGELKVGQPVVAIGSPLGNEGSVTQGVVSAVHRTISAGGGGQSTTTETLQDVLQTDAAINRGNSGGPLADAAGRVVGINVAAAGDGSSNIGFSIPSDLARRVSEQLISHQPVSHPFLGVAYYSPVEAIQAGHPFDGPGVLVHDVRAGTPADKAGFKVGDVLRSIDGSDIDNGQTLGGLIQHYNVGDSVHCTVRRGGQTLTLVATLVNRPSS